MMIEKKFGITLSHKLPNGDIISVNFGTQHQCESILDSAPEEEIAAFSRKLAKKVYKETLNDMEKASAKDELIQEVLKGITGGVKFSKRQDEAEKFLEEEDDD